MSDVGFTEIVEALYDESFNDNEEHQEEDYRYLAAELLVSQDKKITELRTVITDAVKALNENERLKREVNQLKEFISRLEVKPDVAILEVKTIQAKESFLAGHQKGFEDRMLIIRGGDPHSKESAAHLHVNEIRKANGGING